MFSSEILVEAKKHYLLAEEIFTKFDYSIQYNERCLKIISDWPITKSTIINHKLSDVENKIYKRSGEARFIGFYLDDIIQYGYSDSKEKLKFIEEVYFYKTDKSIKYKKNSNKYGKTAYSVGITLCSANKLVAELRLKTMELEYYVFQYNENGVLIGFESFFDHKVGDDIKLEKHNIINYDKEKCIVEKIESKIIKKFDFEQKELLFPWDEI